MRRSILLVLSLMAMLVLAVPVAQAKVPKDFVGVQDDYLYNEDANFQTSNLSAMSAIGVGTIRQSFLWSEIERTPGQFDFTKYDQLVGKASSHGIKFLGVIFGPPSFRQKTAAPKFRNKVTCPPISNKAFGDFAARLAQRYGSKGTFWKENPQLKKSAITSWQIWNEPNIRPYWCGKPNARQYVKLLKAADKALNKADRKSETVTAGLPQSKQGISLLKYIKQMYRAGARSAFDTLAIHNYSRTVPEFNKRLRDVRKLMNRSRDRRAKIWVTEVSWSDVGPGSPFRVGKAGQAKRITGALKFVGKERKRLRLRGAIYVFWRDMPPYTRFDGSPGKDFWGLHTGLLNMDGSFKKAYFAFKKAVSRLR